MPMRVISGAARGRSLKSVPGTGTRPIMDRVKEALFNILSDAVEGVSFLDLYAGTGSVGIEALSRGAERVVFVENSAAAIRVISENLKSTRLEEGAHIVRADVLDYLRQPRPEPFEIIFLAPPQYKGLWVQTLTLIDQHPDHLTPDGIVVVQIDPQENHDLPLQTLRATDERRYGNTLLLFYERPGELPGAVMPDEQSPVQTTIPFDVIEKAVTALLSAFDVPTPPVPVEIMLQRPKAGMWKEINLSELSTTFINVKQRHSPRMSVARLVARYACASDWGTQNKVQSLVASDEAIRAFARAILMPRRMLEAMPVSSRIPSVIGMRFEVPDEDARQRLLDLGLFSGD